MLTSESFLLVGITPEPFQPQQQRLVNRLFAQGLDYLYIRSREGDSEVWRQILEQIDPAFYARLLLPANAPPEAAGGQYIRHIREAERLQGHQQASEPGRLYSTSIHRLEEVPKLAGSYHMVFYSPLFASISKAAYLPGVEWRDIEKQMAALRKAGGRPRVMGLGGVCAGNIGQVKQAGFQGAALLGALWQAEEPAAALAQIQAQAQDCRP